VEWRRQGKDSWTITYVLAPSCHPQNRQGHEGEADARQASLALSSGRPCKRRWPTPSPRTKGGRSSRAQSPWLCTSSIELPASTSVPSRDARMIPQGAPGPPELFHHLVSNGEPSNRGRVKPLLRRRARRRRAAVRRSNLTGVSGVSMCVLRTGCSLACSSLTNGDRGQSQSVAKEHCEAVGSSSNCGWFTVRVISGRAEIRNETEFNVVVDVKMVAMITGQLCIC
jgi:hypothetical protein